MTLPAPLKTAVENDKPVLSSDEAASIPGNDPSGDAVGNKPSAKATGSDDLLNVPAYNGGIRAPSPDTLSNLSVDEWNHLRRSGSPFLGRTAKTPRTYRSAILDFWQKNKGLAMVMLAQLFGTLMNVTTRMLEVEGNNGKGLHPFQILFARMIITVVLSTGYMWWAKIEHFPFGLKEVRRLLVARGLFGFFGVFGMYYSLLYLPLADATVITFLAPSLACWACSYLIAEPFTRMEQIAAFVSLFGVVLIAKPTALFAAGSSAPPASGDADIAPIVNNGTVSSPSHSASNYDSVTPSQRASAVGIAMLGVLGAAGAYTTIRWIGKRAHPLMSVNYFAAWCTFVSTVMMFALPGVGFLLPANLKEWSMLFFLGICGFVMQFLLAAGLAYEKSSRATNMVYIQMLFALSFDKLVFGTTPGILSILGSSLILGSAIYVAVRKDTSQKQGKELVDGDEERGLIEGEISGEREERRGVQEIQMRTMRH